MERVWRMKDIIHCFVKRMNLGASSISAAFENNIPKGATVARDHTRLLGVLWLLFMAVWELLKRGLVLFVLVLVPISMMQNIGEVERIGRFFTLLVCVQFIGGVCSPLGRRHNEPPIPLISQVFWERLKDLVYMPFVIYVFTSSMNVKLLWCFAITAELMCVRLMCEIAFAFVADKFSLLRRGEDVLCVSIGVIGVVGGLGLALSPFGAAVGLWVLTPGVFWGLMLLGIVCLWYLWRNK